MTPLDWFLVALVAALAVAVAVAVLVPRRRRHRLPVPGTRRVLVPFTGELDPAVLAAALRIASAEEATLVPAYLLIVPLQYAEDSPLRDEVEVALPLLEAVEHAALADGVAVDARIEKGRSRTHALRRLWEVEQFDRILVPAPTNGGSRFTENELAWVLTHAPADTDTLVLKPRRARDAAA